MLWMLSSPLAVSPLLKIPLLFGNAVGIHVCYTPPNPIADSQETTKFGYKRDSNLRFKFVRWLAVGAKVSHESWMQCTSG